MAGIKRDLKCALSAVERDISKTANSGSHFARGIATEGYAGGYRDALYDVLSALNRYPSSTSRYWPRPVLGKKTRVTDALAGR